MTQQTFQITGSIRDRQTQTGIAGLRVEAWDKDLIFNDLVGSAITDEQGIFQIEFSEADYRELFCDRRPDLFFKVFNQNNKQIASTEDSVLWNIESGATEIAIEVDIAAPETLERFVVKGQIQRADGTPYAGIFVRAFDKDLRREQALGSRKTTGQEGRYEITYTRIQFCRAEKSSADLIVRVYGGTGDELLAQSEIIFNAKPVEIVDLVVVGDYQAPSEYEQLLAELEPLLVNVEVQGVQNPTPLEKLADLKEDENQQEITFLSRETGLNRQYITFLVLAAQLSLQTQLPPQVFYGLSRRGLSPQLPNLFAQKLGVLRRTLEAAVDLNLIPKFDNQQALEQILDRIKELRLQHTLEETEKPGKASLADLLDTALLEKEKQETFLQLYLDHQDQEPPEPIESFWDSLRSHDTLKDEVDIIQFTLEVGTLTQNHLPLVRKLQNLHQQDALNSPHDWAKLDVEAWTGLIEELQDDGQPIGFPPDVPGKDDAEKANTYAKIMASAIEATYPTPVIAHHIAKADRPEHTDLKKFFARNRDFEFRNTPVETYLIEHESALDNIEQPAHLTKTLKSMQRLFKITPRFAEMDLMLEGSFYSAHDIVSLGAETFSELYSPLLGGPTRAREIYGHAAEIEATANYLLVNYSLSHASPEIAAVSDFHLGSSDFEELELAEAGVAIPTWKTLFGSLDLCDCQHCRSAYSPAAYLVDLLAFLKKRPDNPVAWGATLREIAEEHPSRWPFLLREAREATDGLTTLLQLFDDRRPDIGTLDLSCENTNIILPYVDLVNEVLENVVAPLPDFTPFDISADFKTDLDNRYLSPALQDEFNHFVPTLSAGATIVVLNEGYEWRILDTAYAYSLLDEDPSDDRIQVLARGWQTYGASEELKANPQYVNTAAYDVLAGGEIYYPWNLPFDRWCEETRAYLNHLGVQRYELMTAFQSLGSTAHPSEREIASEYLGLTPAQGGRIVENISPSLLYPDKTLEELKQVSTLLQMAGLTYLELLDLLQTRYINPDGTLQIHSTDPSDLYTCDLTKLAINDYLDQATLKRIHRFVRLWRQLDWSMVELDRAICILKPADRLIISLSQDEWETLLLRLSHLQQIKTDLKVPITKMLGWWSPIDTKEYVSATGDLIESPYADLFLNKATFSSLEDSQPFQLNDAKDQLETFGDITSHLSAIGAALQVSATDLDCLINRDIARRIPSELENTDLNLENLSHLYRVTSFAKALKLSIPDFLTIKALTGLQPLLAPIPITSTTLDSDRVYPEDTLAFVKTVNQIRDSGFSIAELDYLLRYQTQPISGLTPTEDSIAQVLSTLRTGLQTIANEQVIAPDSYGDLTRQKLTQLNWDAAMVEGAIAVLNDTKVFSVELASLPIPLPIPPAILGSVLSDEEKAELSRKLSWNSPSTLNYLQFEGVMTNEEKDALEVLSADLAYQDAIDQLFNTPREFIINWMKAYDPKVTTPLTVLPKDVVFPNDLKQKISYNPVTQELHYIGIMSEGEEVALKDLSGNLDYQAAITALFTASNAPPAENNQFLTSIDCDPLLNNTTIEERFAYILGKVLPYLRQTLSQELIKQTLSETLGLEAAIIHQLLTEQLSAAMDASQTAIFDFLNEEFVNSQSTIAEATFPEQFQTYKRLHKIATAITKFKISAKELAWIADNASRLEWLDLTTLPVIRTEADVPFPNWENLNNALQLRNRLPKNSIALFDLFDPLASDRATYLNTLSSLTNWDLNELEILAGDTGLLNLTFPDSFQDAAVLMHLKRCFDLIKRLGVSASTIRDWIEPSLNFEAARSTKQAVKAKYDPEQWLEIAKPLRDILREKQRSALVAYLTHHPHLWLPGEDIAALEEAGQHPDANKLYARFLLDVEMSPCMMTSRLKQAIASVQLFVQRCLMGIEKDVSLGKDAKEQWKWMKNYRVWEANRKVFLYPENWIEPELRDEKSPFFKELESELLQNELNDDTATTAIAHYLDKLDAVAQLKVCGMYHQVGAGTNILHVFGRTQSIPPIYYYRRWVDMSYWTAWERVNVDIVGDHLIPVVHLGRLKLFWPIFTETITERTDYDPEREEPPKHWEIQLAWSEYKNGKWSAKKMSIDTLSDRESLISRELPAKGDYFFKSLQWGSNLAIIGLRGSGAGVDIDLYDLYIGVFCFMDCRDTLRTQGFLNINDSDANKPGAIIKNIPYPLINEDTARIYNNVAAWHYKHMPSRSLINSMRFSESDDDSSEDSLKIASDYFLKDQIQLLNKTPGTFHLIYLHQLYWYQYLLLDLIKRNPGIINLLRIPLAIPNFQFLRIPSSFFYQDDFRSFFVIPFPSEEDIELSRCFLTELRSSLIDEVTDLVALDGSGSSIFDTDETSAPAFGLLTWLSTLLSTLIPEIPTKLDSRYLFMVFYHPYLCHFIRTLRQQGLEGLFKRNIQLGWNEFFEAEYEPESVVIKGNEITIDVGEATDVTIYSLYPRDVVDFSFGGSYSQYNWEVLFHTPLLIAKRLSDNQRFAEAQKWFHYIFDPTQVSNVPVPSRYWITKPFYLAGDKYEKESIRILLRTLASKDTGNETRRKLVQQVMQWRHNPFNPQLIARFRTTAYQKSVVIKYIDNLIAWGDYLFRQDTMESINEATQLYILAAELLGPRPEKIPPRASLPTRTVNDLVQNRGLDEFSNLLEDVLPAAYSGSGDSSGSGSTPPDLGILYFCIPKNEKLLEKWDEIEDRLFKIRHCMNIEGVTRELPLFQPPIEPGLLVKAVAAGIDISSVLNDMNAPLPHYRFQIMLQKALELCTEVKALGAALLSALEKQDADELALLRSGQEIGLLEKIQTIKEEQVEEAEKAIENAYKNLEISNVKANYYLAVLNSSHEAQSSPGSQGDVGEDITQSLNQEEQGQLENLANANEAQTRAGENEATTQTTAFVPNIQTPIGPGTSGPSSSIGGMQLNSILTAVTRGDHIEASKSTYGAQRSSIMAGHIRNFDRSKDLDLEVSQKEIAQINDNLIPTAQLRKAIAEHERDNHITQIENAKTVDTYMYDKFTSKELYGWMVSQISAVYFQSYKLAYDIAKRAEKAYRYELGLDDSNFVQFGYWDSLKKGLLSGEKLYHDLKHLEIAYLDKNKREYELTKHISLAQLDPIALVKLRETGECFVSIPEFLFDLDYPSHYFRRIKSVSLTIPCVAGPYTSVSCTLILQSDRYRKKTTMSDTDEYKWNGNFEDKRFNYNWGGIQSIATSTAQNDSGIFELNFRDERYLPFEGAGTISTWHIQLPKDFRQFDYDTISDVVIHMRYTAREGGEKLKKKVTEYIETLFADLPLFRAFSAKQEFSSEWHQFLHPKETDTSHKLDLAITPNRFPFQFRNKSIVIKTMQLFLKLKDNIEYNDSEPLSLTLKNPTGNRPYTVPDPDFMVGGSPVQNFPYLKAFEEQNETLGAWSIEVPGVDIASDDTEIPSYLSHPDNPQRLNPDAIEDLIIICHYSISSS